MKMILAITMLIATVAAASAGGNTRDIERFISRDRAMNLSSTQKALIRNYINTNRSISSKRNYVRSIAGRR